LSASELVRTIHAKSAAGRAPDAARGFERGIRPGVGGARPAVGVERNSHRHAGAAPAPSKPSRMRLPTNQRDRHISPNEDTVMESVGDEKSWTIDLERRPYGLRVVLPRRSYVLPWGVRH